LHCRQTCTVQPPVRDASSAVGGLSDSLECQESGRNNTQLYPADSHKGESTQKSSLKAEKIIDVIAYAIVNTFTNTREAGCHKSCRLDWTVDWTGLRSRWHNYIKRAAYRRWLSPKLGQAVSTFHLCL